MRDVSKLLILAALLVGGLFPFQEAQAQSAVSDLARSMQIQATINPAQATTPGSAVRILGSPLADGTVGLSYSGSLTATGGVPPYTWNVIAGSVPSGLLFTGAGAIVGTPTTPGASMFAAQVTDSAGSFSASGFTLTVDPAPLKVTAVSLPNGIATSPYPTQIIGATGGAPPYTFALTGSLAPGLTFANGQISGTPFVPGTSVFTITATDSLTNSASANFSISVSAFHADLVPGQASQAFALSTGSTSVPAGAVNIPIRSSDPTQNLSYSVSLSQPAPWLDVSTGGGKTPSTIGLALDPSALSLGVGTNNTSVTVTCISPSPCSGNTQTIPVSLTVSAPAPQLSLSTGLLSYSFTSGAQSVSQVLGIQNAGGGIITVNSVTANAPWISISNIPATLPPGPPVQLLVTVTPGSLAAGFYQSTITVTSSAGSLSVPVNLLISPNPLISLNPGGAQLYSVAGNAPGNTTGSFSVSVSGATGTVNWSAVRAPAVGWLALNTTSGTSTQAAPGTVSYSINTSVAATLAVGTYYATIRVTANNVADPLLDYQVVLNVLPAGSISVLDIEPQGAVFSALIGASGSSQTTQVFTSSPSLVTYQASTDASWLTVSPAIGSISAASPGQSTITVTPGTLLPGVYRGNVSYALSPASGESVNVTLIIESTKSGTTSRVTTSTTAPACTPSQLVLAQIGPANSFAEPASWPTPLTIRLLNDCGIPIANGQVVTTFSNGDPAIVLEANDSASGLYWGTWTPRASAANVTMTSRATAPGFAAASIQTNGEATRNSAPVLSPNGTVNVFGAPPGSPVAPGEIVSIYGNNLGGDTPAFFPGVPLTTTLGNTSVIIGGVQAPLYYVGQNQINAQVPFELSPGMPYQIIVNANGALSTPETLQVANDGPGVVTFGAGYVVTEHANGVLVTDSSPAAPGEYITVYTTGMGLTVDTVASGQPSPASPYPTALDQPTVLLNGNNVPVTQYFYAGLSPTYVGLDQVTFQVPANAPNGDLQLVIVQSGGQTNPAILPVHN